MSDVQKHGARLTVLLRDTHSANAFGIPQATKTPTECTGPSAGNNRSQLSTPITASQIKPYCRRLDVKGKQKEAEYFFAKVKSIKDLYMETSGRRN